MLKLTNNSLGLLGSSLSAGATSLTLAAGAGSNFPSLSAGDWFPITVVQAADPSQFEIMRVTARSGDLLTVVRAQEGTTAKAFAAGDVAEMRLTAGTLQEAFAQLIGTDSGAKGLRFSVSDVSPGQTRTLTMPDRDVTLGSAADQDDDRYAHRANNLSDLPDAATARSNLGLGSAATRADTFFWSKGELTFELSGTTLTITDNS